MLTASPELARLVLKDGPDAMLVTNAAGAILFANHQAGALFSCDCDELIGRNVDTLMPERFRHGHAVHREHYLRRPRAGPMRQGMELIALRLDGAEIPVEISLSPIAAAGDVLLAAAIRDVSNRRRIEHELTAARTAAEQARESAMHASQTKSRFLATASHDLRQPLQTLALLNGTLRRVVADADIAQILTQQERAIGAMSRLINALLDISKLESGAVRPDPVDFPVAAIFEELRREFAGLATEKQLQLEIGPAPVRAHSDPSLVEQVLRNLVSNAIKYTHRGKVTLRCLPLSDSLLRLEVLDTGIGIPASQLSCIYDEFYQVGVATNRERDGYGLGLSIVKRIVDLLDVRLEVSSQPAEGSSFSLLLPTAPAQPDAVGSSESEPPVRLFPANRRPRRVLLVEDDPAVREALGRPLKAVLITADTSRAIRDLPDDPDLRIASKPLKAEEMLTLMDRLV